MLTTLCASWTVFKAGCVLSKGNCMSVKQGCCMGLCMGYPMQRVELSRTPKPSRGTGGYGGSYRDDPPRGGSYAGGNDSYRRDRR